MSIPIERVAAQYWSKFLRDAMKKNEEAAGLALVDVLHRGVPGNFAITHAHLINDLAGTLTEDGIEKFENALTDEIKRKLIKWHGDCAITKDYDPCEEIMSALEAGGMPERRYGFFFPMKTIQRISDSGKITIEK